MTLTVTASKQNPTLCEDVTFTATTNPPEYASQVQWSAPGGEPDGAYSDPSSTFTTHWPCKGSETVTATLGSLSRSAGVNVVLPNGCSEGSAMFSITPVYSLGCPANLCQANPNGFGCNAADPNATAPVTGGTSAVYNGCAWAWQVNYEFHRAYGTCPRNFTDICSISDIDLNDRTEENIASVIQALLSGGTTAANCSDCTWMHETVHKNAFCESVARDAQEVGTGSLIAPLSIDCADPNTTSCTAAQNSPLGQAITDVVNTIYDSAVAAQGSVEEEATLVGNACKRDVGCEFCYYADGQGWDLPEGCLSDCTW